MAHTGSAEYIAEQALKNGIEKGIPLREMLKLYVAFIYERHERNKVHTAKTLKVNRRSLQRWNLDK